MNRLVYIMIFLLGFASAVNSGTLSGIFVTNPSKSTGGWAHVKFGPCKENKELTCGTLVKAFSKNKKPVKNYEHKGKYVVWNMRDEGSDTFSGGKIKDYSDGKVYNSKMELVSEKKLAVSGCVFFICQSQEWNRVK